MSELTEDGAGTVALGDLKVRRLGFGAMRLTGEGVWGPPDDAEKAKAVLRRAVELGIDLIDTADSYGPYVAENLIRSPVMLPIPGTSSIEHLEQNVGAAQIALTDGDMAELNAAA